MISSPLCVFPSLEPFSHPWEGKYIDFFFSWYSFNNLLSQIDSSSAHERTDGHIHPSVDQARRDGVDFLTQDYVSSVIFWMDVPGQERKDGGQHTFSPRYKFGLFLPRSRAIPEIQQTFELGFWEIHTSIRSLFLIFGSGKKKH